MNIPKEALERMKNSITEENKLLEEMKALIGDQLEGLKQEEDYMRKKTADIEKRVAKANEFKFVVGNK